MSDKLRFGEILVRAGLLERAQLDSAISDLEEDDGDLGEHLVERNLVDEGTMLQAIGRALNLPTVSLTDLKPDERALGLVPHEFCVKHTLFPVELDRTRNGEHLHVAMANPSDVQAIKQVTRRARRRIRPLVAPAREIREAIDRHYGGKDAEERKSGSRGPGGSPVDMFDFDVTDLSSLQSDPGQGFDLGGGDAVLAAASTIDEPSLHSLGPEVQFDTSGLGGVELGDLPAMERAPMPPPRADGPPPPRPMSGPIFSSPPPPAGLEPPRAASASGAEAFDQPLPSSSSRKSGVRGSGIRSRRPSSEPMRPSPPTSMPPRPGPTRSSLPPTAALPSEAGFGMMVRKRRRPSDRSAPARAPSPPPPKARPPDPFSSAPPSGRSIATSLAPSPAPATSLLASAPARAQEGIDIRRLFDQIDGRDEELAIGDQVIAQYLEQYGAAPASSSAEILAVLDRALDRAGSPTARLLVLLIRRLSQSGLVDPKELLSELTRR